MNRWRAVLVAAWGACSPAADRDSVPDTSGETETPAPDTSHPTDEPTSTGTLDDTDPRPDSGARIETPVPDSTALVDSQATPETDLPVDTTDTHHSASTDTPVDTTAPVETVDSDLVDSTQDSPGPRETVQESDSALEVPPPGPSSTPPSCVIPAPGSVASTGALTTNHLTNRIVIEKAVDNRILGRADGDGDHHDEVIVYQQRLLSTAPPRPTLYRTSLVDPRGVVGKEPHLPREDAYLYPSGIYTEGWLGSWSGDFDGSGASEISGFSWTGSRVDGFLLFFSQPLDPAGQALDDFAYGLRNIRWNKSTVWAAAIGDWNVDGVPDYYVTGNYTGSGSGFESMFLAGPLDSAVGGWIDMDNHVFARMLWTQTWDSPGFTATGDYDSDGYDDIAISQFVVGTNGEVRIWFGPLAGDIDPSVPDTLITSTQPGTSLSMGTGMKEIGDVNGDGHVDLVVPSQHDDFDGMEDVGAVHIFLGPLPRGVTLHETDAYASIRWVHEEAATGSTTWPLGDVDGNGTADFAVHVREASTFREPADHPVPIAPLPPGIERDPVCAPYVPLPPLLDTGLDTQDTGTGSGCVSFGYPVGSDNSEGAILVFSNPPPGDLGPEDALLVIKGDRIGAVAGSHGLQGMGDLDGDGLDDFVFRAQDLQPDGSWEDALYVVHPCSEYGERVPTP